MARRYLSGEELLHHIKFIKHKPELPQRGGFKEYQPDGSWLQNKRLEYFFDERRSILQEERVQKISSLAIGEWDETQCRVVVKKSGKFWKNLGHVENGVQLLYPEEALFLIDEGVMEVYRGGVPLSVEEAYSVLLRSEIPLEHYQVFAHLCRLGYIVQRFEKTFTKSEMLREFDEKHLNSKKNSKKRKRQTVVAANTMNKRTKDESAKIEDRCADDRCRSNAEISDDRKETKISIKEFSNNELKEASKLLELDVDCDSCGKNFSAEFSVVDLPSRVAGNIADHENSRLFSESNVCRSVEEDGILKTSSEKAKAVSSTFWDFQLIKFPDISTETSSEIIMKPPPSHLLPPGVEILKPFYTIDLRNYRRNTITKRCLPSKVVSPKSSARNWAEYKMMLASTSERERLVSSPAGVLWRGDVFPLVKPSQAISTAAVLSRLKVVQNFDPISPKESVNCEEDELQPLIIFNVYLPDSKFRKSNPGTPSVCLCINRQSDLSPSFADLCCNLRRCPKGATLMWAVVDNGDVAFYSFNSVNLPMDDSFP